MKYTDPAILTLAISNIAACIPAHKSAGEKPNIVLIIAEDMSRDLGCYGSPFMKTPFLDKLASEGILFNNAYTTQASSSPSRSSIFTGLYPHENGQIGLVHEKYIMHREIPNLLANIKKCGYYTIQIGKVHTQAQDEYQFDYHDTRMVNDPFFYRNETEKILKKIPPSPFFMMISLKDAHILESGKYEIPAGYDREILKEDQVMLPSWFGGITGDKLNEMLLGYYNAVLRVDYAVGLIEVELKKQGLEKNTCIIFISDHGASLLRAKCTIYESGIAIPFIVKWPGKIKPGQKSDALISVTDIFPTLMEMSGGEKPPFPVEGKSFLPLCTGKNVKWRAEIFAEWNSDTPDHFLPQRSIRDKRYKLIENSFPGKPKHIIFNAASLLETNNNLDPWVESHYRMLLSPPRYELYDLVKDPDEFINLAYNENYKEIRNTLLIKLKEWQNRTRDFLTCDSAQFNELTRIHNERNDTKEFSLDKFRKDWSDVLKFYKK